MARSRSSSFNDVNASGGGWDRGTGAPALSPRGALSSERPAAAPAAAVAPPLNSPLSSPPVATRPPTAADATAHGRGLHDLLGSSTTSAAASAADDFASLFRTDEDEARLRDDARLAEATQASEDAASAQSGLADARADLLCAEEARDATAAEARSRNHAASSRSGTLAAAVADSKRAARAAARAARAAAAEQARCEEAAASAEEERIETREEGDFRVASAQAAVRRGREAVVRASPPSSPAASANRGRRRGSPVVAAAAPEGRGHHVRVGSSSPPAEVRGRRAGASFAPAECSAESSEDVRGHGFRDGASLAPANYAAAVVGGRGGDFAPATDDDEFPPLRSARHAGFSGSDGDGSDGAGGGGGAGARRGAGGSRGVSGPAPVSTVAQRPVALPSRAGYSVRHHTAPPARDAGVSVASRGSRGDRGGSSARGRAPVPAAPAGVGAGSSGGSNGSRSGRSARAHTSARSGAAGSAVAGGGGVAAGSSAARSAARGPPLSRGRHWSDSLDQPRDTLNGEASRYSLLEEQEFLRFARAERIFVEACKRGEDLHGSAVWHEMAAAEASWLGVRRRLWKLEEKQGRRAGVPVRHDWTMQRAAEEGMAADRAAVAVGERRQVPRRSTNRGTQPRATRGSRRSRREREEGAAPESSSLSSSSSRSSEGEVVRRETFVNGTVGLVASSRRGRAVPASRGAAPGEGADYRRKRSGGELPADFPASASGRRSELEVLRRGVERMMRDEDARVRESARPSPRSRPRSSASAASRSRVSASPPAPHSAPRAFSPSRADDERVSMKLSRTRQSDYVNMRVPLPRDNVWAALATLVGRLRAVIDRMRSSAGDRSDTRWNRAWIDPAIQFLVGCVSDGAGKTRFVSELLKLHQEVERVITSKALYGEDAFAELVRQFTLKFTDFSVTHAPVMLAQYSVPNGTPIKEWYSLFREMCGGLRCFGDHCPSPAQILRAAADSLNRQYPEIHIHLAPLITACSDVEEMWSLFDDNGLATNHSPAKRMMEPVSQPRVHAVSSTGQYDVSDTNGSAFELCSDEEGYQYVPNRSHSAPPQSSQYMFPVARSGMAPIKFWKHRQGSPQGELLRASLGRVCYNCGRDNHMLRDCPDAFRNVCEMFDERFGEGTEAQVDVRWRAKLRSLQEKARLYASNSHQERSAASPFT